MSTISVPEDGRQLLAFSVKNPDIKILAKNFWSYCWALLSITSTRKTELVGPLCIEQPHGETRITSSHCSQEAQPLTFECRIWVGHPYFVQFNSIIYQPSRKSSKINHTS